MMILLATVALADPDYDAVKARVESRRLEFRTSYLAADSCGKERIVDEARAYLFDRITLEIFPAWYGTPWDFNGTTRVPGEGHIACGYFVNTVLQDAGFKLPRIRWSQMAAEPITLKLSHKVKRFRNRPISEVERYILSQPDGLFKVGMDNHVGFIMKRGNEARFVHSSYYRREEGVLSEPLDGYNPLRDSSYRIVGSLLGDDMMKAWILGTDLASL